MENNNTSCPVCTLYLREGITLQAHLDTHPKEQVIEALLKVSNAGSYTPSSQVPPASVNPFMPVQSNSSYMAQTGPYVNPQAQMTTAVTYQHFMTSNGSPVMPHYIQVPASVNSNNSIPVISNQAMNFVPNQTVNYAQTLYNPLYNPYIPQPYPFTQPIFTGFPIATLPSVDSNTQTVNEEPNLSKSSRNPPSGMVQTNVTVKKCTVGTSTDGNKRVSKNSGSKKPILRTPSTTNKRAKILKQRKSDSAVRRSVKSGPGSNKLGRISKSTTTSSAGTTITVIRTLRPKAITATTSSNKTPFISPPPLTLITGATTRSMSDSKTPPPPPLAKAPYFIPQLLNYIKSEDVPDCARPQSLPAMINELSNSSSNLSVEYVGHRKKLSTVIVENSNSVQSSVSESKDFKQRDESKESGERSSDPLSAILNKERDSPKDPLSTETSDEITIDEDTNNLKECPEEEEEEAIEDTTMDDEDGQEKVFHMIEVEDNKVEISEDVLNHDIPRESESENGDKNRDGSDLYIREQNIAFSEDSNREKTNESFPEFVEVGTVRSDNKSLGGKSETQTSSSDFNYFNKQFTEATYDSSRSGVSESMKVGGGSSVKGTEKGSTTYTDLQPAKTSKVLPEVEPINFNNYMEVDGIKIFFKNQSSKGTVDTSIKGTSGIQPKSKNLLGFLKSEHQTNSNQTIVDSVIQITSSTGESKSEFTFRDSYPASSSQVSESNLDVPDLSPLALNIQADESMPARGELSEQESLGAENSTWNLYHGSNAVDNVKTIDEWRNDNASAVSVIGTKKSSKAFRCSICNEVFSCPKERRVHKNTVHVTVKGTKIEKGLPAKKAKTVECSFCSEVFSCVRDRKVHVVQTHILGTGGKSKKNANTNTSMIKKEKAEPEYINLDGSVTAVKNETEHEEKFKTEITTATPIQIPTPTPTAIIIPPPVDIDPQRLKYCSKCSLPFDGVKKLREHLRLAHGEIRFKCDKCSKCFDEEPEYNEHLLIHPLVCDKCGKSFHRKPNLNLHMKRHLEVKPYECSLCPKSFITRQKLEEHMNGHSGKKPIKCTLCDKTFSRHSNLIQHRNLHHFNVKKKLKDFVCRCGEVFHSLRKLEWHKEIHDPKPKPCPFCSQKFIHSASVTRHIRRSHIPEYLPGDNRELDNVNCPVCDKVYLRSSLLVHLRVHNGEKPFQCKICNKRFSTKWNLELHNWTHQSRNNMPFKCHICKSAFFREPDFVAHINSHRNYKPFTCNICGQKFIRKYSCLRHQEEHRKTKQFVCAVSGCEKSFHRGYYLRDHMKVHTGLRPHTCHICGKASSTKSNHNKHVRIHDTREPINTEN